MNIGGEPEGRMGMGTGGNRLGENVGRVLGEQLESGGRALLE